MGGRCLTRNFDVDDLQTRPSIRGANRLEPTIASNDPAWESSGRPQLDNVWSYAIKAQPLTVGYPRAVT